MVPVRDHPGEIYPILAFPAIVPLPIGGKPAPKSIVLNLSTVRPLSGYPSLGGEYAFVLDLLSGRIVTPLLSFCVPFFEHRIVPT